MRCQYTHVIINDQTGVHMIRISLIAISVAVATPTLAVETANMRALQLPAQADLPKIRMAPPLAPQVRGQAFQQLMKSSTPPPSTGTFTLSTQKPLEPGRGSLSFQNVVNAWPGDVEKPSANFPLGFTQVRFTSKYESQAFGNATLYLAATAGQGFMVDCNVYTLSEVIYTVTTPDKVTFQAQTTLPKSGPLYGHLLIAVPKSASAGYATVTFHPKKAGVGVTDSEISVYGCDVTPY